MNAKNFGIMISVVGLMFVLTGCDIVGTQVNLNTLNIQSNPPGFLLGVWQGFIAPISFIVSFFDPNVGIYSRVNDGHGYDFGYLIGLGVIGASVYGGARSRRG